MTALAELASALDVALAIGDQYTGQRIALNDQIDINWDQFEELFNLYINDTDCTG
jgi:hypothetical protein